MVHHLRFTLRCSTPIQFIFSSTLVFIFNSIISKVEKYVSNRNFYFTFFLPCLTIMEIDVRREHAVACVDSSSLSIQAANKHCSEKKHTQTFTLHALKVVHVPVFTLARYTRFIYVRLRLCYSVHFEPFHIRGFYQKCYENT